MRRVALLTLLARDDEAAVARAYGLSDARFTPLPERGTVNSNYAIAAAGHRYFLRINEGKTPAHVGQEIAIVIALVAGGVPTPPPLPTTTGERLVMVKGRAATLFEWIDGAEAEPRRSGAAAQCGELLAHLHAAGLAHPELVLPANLYTLDELSRRAAAARATGRFAATVDRCEEELGAARARDRGPVGLIHQDLFPDNVIVDGDGHFLAVLDFEQATRGPLLYDLAVALNAWCWRDTAFDLGACDELVGAYAATRGIAAAERARLPGELRLAAARFTLTRITDIEMQGDVHPELKARKDYRDFERRLIAWQNGAAAKWAERLAG